MSSTPNSQENLAPDPIVPDPLVAPDPIVLPTAAESSPVELAPSPVEPTASVNTATQLQQFSARLLNLQTNVVVEIPPGLAIVHLGKPNDRIPPDVDLSGFPNSEIVSRIHADIRIEGDAYYIEDVGSSNGTYINNAPLPMGNRHRLRPGDRIAFGKGDKVSFLFQM
jgi:pSer/pThr/pTyr-binding forkhead associated (FHA) protein